MSQDIYPGKENALVNIPNVPKVTKVTKETTKTTTGQTRSGKICPKTRAKQPPKLPHDGHQSPVHGLVAHCDHDGHLRDPLPGGDRDDLRVLCRIKLDQNRPESPPETPKNLHYHANQPHGLQGGHGHAQGEVEIDRDTKTSSNSIRIFPPKIGAKTSSNLIRIFPPKKAEPALEPAWSQRKA